MTNINYMKRIIIFTASILAQCFFAFSCKQQASEEEIQAIKIEIDSCMQVFQEELKSQISKIVTIEGISEEEKDQMFESYYVAKIDTLRTLLESYVLKNNDNAAGLQAYKYYSMFTETEEQMLETEQLFSKLSRSVREEYNKFIDFQVDAVVKNEDGSEETKQLSLSDFVGKGKYVLVDFWASWCGPCRAELPNIASVYEKFAGEDFDVLSIAVWDEPSNSYDAIEQHEMKWNQIVPVEACSTVPSQTYDISGIPQIMLFGPDGTIVARDLRGEFIEKTVAKYVNAK